MTRAGSRGVISWLGTNVALIMRGPGANFWSDPTNSSFWLMIPTKTQDTRCFGVSYVKCKQEGDTIQLWDKDRWIINQVMLPCLYCQVFKRTWKQLYVKSLWYIWPPFRAVNAFHGQVKTPSLVIQSPATLFIVVSLQAHLIGSAIFSVEISSQADPKIFRLLSTNKRPYEPELAIIMSSCLGTSLLTENC